MTSDGKVFTPYEKESLQLLRSLPGAKWNREEKCWTFSLRYEDRKRVIEIGEKLGLEIDSGLKDIEDPPEVLEAQKRIDGIGCLYPFQVEGIKWLVPRQKALLFDDMGSGKTLQALIAIPKNKGCLAIVPACVKYNWVNEIKKWRPNLNITVLAGKSKFTKDDYKILDYLITNKSKESIKSLSKIVRLNEPSVRLSLKRLSESGLIENIRSGRKKYYFSHLESNPINEGGEDNFTWPKPGEIVITNRDILPKWLETPLKPKKPSTYGFNKQETENYEKLYENYKSKKQELDSVLKRESKFSKDVVLIVDEAHQFKNYKTKGTKKLTSLSKIVDRTWFLTGTPLLNHPFDLWGILCAGDMSSKVFNWNMFLNLFNGFKGRFGGYEFGDPKPEVSEMIKKIALRRTKKEVLPDLPPKIYQDIMLECPKGLEKSLDDAWDEYDGNYDKDELPPFEQFSQVRAMLAEEKISHALDQIALFEEQETPLIVFSSHRKPIREIAKREGWEFIDGLTPPKRRQEIVDEFQGGKLKGIAATIEAAGVGLTMTRSSHVLFIDLDWTPALNTQAEDRCHRIGTTSDKVHIMRMIFDHPMDRHVISLLTNKSRMIETALESKIEVDSKNLNAKAQGFKAQEINEETEEEFRERMEKIKDEAQKIERERLLKKVGGKLGDLTSGGSTKIPVITDDISSDLKDAWRYMLSVCDGAFEKDGSGFNKPDASVAHWMMPVLDDEKSLQVAWLILKKYKRQLLEKYPRIYI